MRTTTLLLLFATVVCAENPALFPIFEKGKWGYINPKGEVVIEKKFKYAMPFSEGLAKAMDEKGKYGFIDETGAWVIPPRHKLATLFQGGACAADEKFLDRTGKVIIEASKGTAKRFSDGLISRVKRHDNKYWILDVTYFNLKGEAVLKLDQVQRAAPFTEGLAAITRAKERDVRISYIDKTGKEILKGFIAGGPFSEGLAYAGKPGESGYIDKSGKWAFLVRGTALPFKNGLARVIRDEKVHFYTKRGKLAFEATFDFARDFSDGIAAVQPDRKTKLWGFIDRTGKIVIEPQYKGVGDFEHGIARVITAHEGKKGWGYIDKTGKVIWKYTG